jgi:hypothetical protein
MRRRDRVLLWITGGVLAISISGPAMEYVIGPVINPVLRRLFPVHAPTLIMAPFALLWFLDYVLGKGFCVLLAVCVLLVLVSSGIWWWIKIGLTVSAGFTCYVLLRWVERVSHQW